jgi:hypothetical protein
MRIHLFLMLLFAATSFLSSCTQEPKAEEPPPFFPAPGQTSGLQFDHLSHVFGDVPSGTVVVKNYNCKNLGQGPITIEHVYYACPSCMTVEYPKDPIPMGAIRTVTVKFDTKDKTGRFERLVSVKLAGSDYPITLYLNGDVKPVGAPIAH